MTRLTNNDGSYPRVGDTAEQQPLHGAHTQAEFVAVRGDTTRETTAHLKWPLIIFALLLVALVVLEIVIRSDEKTLYAPGFTWEAYAEVRCGMSVDELTELLGPPLTISRSEYEQVLTYGKKSVNPGPYRWFIFDKAGKLISHGGVPVQEHNIELGMTIDELKAMLGEPDSVAVNRPGRTFVYANQDPAHCTSNYWLIMVFVGGGDRVEGKSDRFMID